jgi:Tfp pilus assembly protein PilF
MYSTPAKVPIMPDDLRRVLVYGRLPGLNRARIAENLVKIGGKLVRDGRSATAIVLAHATAPSCVAGDAIVLPFETAAGATLLSEAGFRQRLGAGPTAAPAAGPYTADEVARLSGLSPEACRTLGLFDVLAPAAGMHGYADVATARQVARLLGEGVPFGAILKAGIELGRRGVRVSQVRLAAAPWGEVVQRMGETLAQFDGQFALVLDEEAQNAEASFAEAQASEASGDLAEAERWYRRADRLDKADPVIPFNLGNVLAAQSRMAEAEVAFRRALGRDPAFAEAAFNLGRLFETQGRDAEALRVYVETITAHPAYAQALFNAGRLLTKAERFGEALPLWERFLSLAPDDPDAGQARRMALLCRLETRTGS